MGTICRSNRNYVACNLKNFFNIPGRCGCSLSSNSFCKAVADTMKIRFYFSGIRMLRLNICRALPNPAIAINNTTNNVILM